MTNALASTYTNNIRARKAVHNHTVCIACHLKPSGGDSLRKLLIAKGGICVGIVLKTVIVVLNVVVDVAFGVGKSGRIGRMNHFKM
jgi:hypothetical protein